ncbi:MAG: SDR family NAD(P)-dependent oxidoreductase [Spirochaetaceae bacterium]|nr:SDR family NAD(P)-dependent oxidoreductase [Spirochaetaceae bacterium]
MTDGGQPRSALITGGANGFGLATARALLGRGERVTIADIDRRKLDAARAALPQDGLHSVELDVTTPASVRAAVEAHVAAHGGLDCLVNCAGIIHLAPLAEIGEEDWDRTIDVDLKGTFLCSQAAAPHLTASGRGRIVTIGSDASHVGFPMIPHYCAAKHGVLGLTRALAGELAPGKVTVNCVCPVGVPTTGMGQQVVRWKMDATGSAAKEIRDATAAGIPLGRNATEDDIVQAILFFLSDKAAFITGSALDVDGGMMSTIPVPGT